MTRPFIERIEEQLNYAWQITLKSTDNDISEATREIVLCCCERALLVLAREHKEG